MSEPLYFSRARLNAGRGEALAPYSPRAARRRQRPYSQRRRTASSGCCSMMGAGTAHRRCGGKNRLFLWREKAPGEYYVLSRTPPRNGHELFSLDTQEFTPSLRRGDVLRFSLRANPVVTRKNGCRESRKETSTAKAASGGFAATSLWTHCRHTTARTGRAMPKAGRCARRSARGDREGARTTGLRSRGARRDFALVKKPDVDDGVFLALPTT